MEKYLFFDDDWKDLGDEVEYIYRKHKDAQDEMTKTIKNRKFGLTTDISYKTSLSIFKVFDGYLKELIDIKRYGKVVQTFPPEEGVKTVSMGTTVIARNLTDDKEITLTIRSYWVANNDNDRVAYNAPLSKVLIGARVGEIREGLIDGVKKKYEVLEII